MKCCWVRIDIEMILVLWRFLCTFMHQADMIFWSLFTLCTTNHKLFLFRSFQTRTKSRISSIIKTNVTPPLLLPFLNFLFCYLRTSSTFATFYELPPLLLPFTNFLHFCYLLRTFSTFATFYELSPLLLLFTNFLHFCYLLRTSSTFNGHKCHMLCIWILCPYALNRCDLWSLNCIWIGCHILCIWSMQWVDVTFEVEIASELIVTFCASILCNE